MSDYAMCAATCPRSTTCKRHEDSGTVPGDFQSWMVFDPENCGDYWPVENIWINCDPNELRKKAQRLEDVQVTATFPAYQREINLWTIEDD